MGRQPEMNSVKTVFKGIGQKADILRIKEHGFAANIPGCCDPEHPFRPIPPNDCRTCRKHADYTCWNFYLEGPKKVKKNAQR